MGRDNRSHISWSRRGRRTFKPACDFFNFFRPAFFGQNYCADECFASSTTGLSAAMVAGGSPPVLRNTIAAQLFPSRRFRQK